MHHALKRLRARPAARVVAALFAASAGSASAATIAWTDWTSVSLPGSIATGVITPVGGGGNIAVQFTGPNVGGSTTGTFLWGPSSTYIGGVVSNAPCTGTTSCTGDMINLTGGTPPTTQTLTFSSPVTNPVFAIWSLGASGTPASLTFPAGTAPAIQSTGTNTTFGFTSLTTAGNVLTGREGNGTFLLPGTYSSIAFTAGFENFYGFTVGQAGVLAPSPVPEPGTWGLLAAGLGLLGFMAKRRARL